VMIAAAVLRVASYMYFVFFYLKYQSSICSCDLNCYLDHYYLSMHYVSAVSDFALCECSSRTICRSMLFIKLLLCMYYSFVVKSKCLMLQCQFCCMSLVLIYQFSSWGLFLFARVYNLL